MNNWTSLNVTQSKGCWAYGCDKLHRGTNAPEPDTILLLFVRIR